MAVGALAAQGDAILSAAEAALVLATTGHAAPGKAFRSHGPPNLELCCDDGVLAVWLAEINHGPVNSQGPEPGCDPAENYAVWVIGLYRCWPSGNTNAPTADEYDNASESLLIDAWALLTELYDRNRNETLLPGCDCQTVRWGDLVPVDPEGGCAGWEMRLTVDLACLADTGS